MASNRCHQSALVLAALLIFLISLHTAAAQSLDALDAAYRDWMKRHYLQRGELAVAYRHRLVFAKGYGGVQPSQPVLLASLSKAVTGLCIAHLVDAGLLKFDAPVGDVLADYFRKWGEPADPRIKQATVAELLAQRSGYDGKDDDPASGPKTLPGYLASYPSSFPSMDRLLSRALRQPLVRPPGERYAYSNLSYLMLGVIIEQASHQTYENYCRTTVLQPLGVDANLDPTWTLLGSFAGWRMSGPQYLKVLDAFGGTSKVLGPRGRAFLTDPTDKWMTESRDVYYALGMVVRPVANGRNLAHPGEWHYRYNSRVNPNVIENVGAYAVSYADGGSVFAHFRPYPGDAALAELDRVIGQAVESITRWPSEDSYATGRAK